MGIWSKPKIDYTADIVEIRINTWEITDDDYRIAETNGLDRKLVYNRVYGGMSVEDAITRPLHLGKGKHVDGLWTTWGDKSEVCKSAFYNNIRSGMTPEQAIKRRRVRKDKVRYERN